MRVVHYLGALFGLGALVATAPAGLSLDVRDEVKSYCGVTTVYVTAPTAIGEGFSMTITRTSHQTAFVTKTVGKSTATEVVEVTISSAVSQSESSAIVTDSAVSPISSEITDSVEETTTLRTTATRTQTRTIYQTTTLSNGDVEVVPITVEEAYHDVTPVSWPTRTESLSVPSLITRLTTVTNWHTTTIKTTTTLPNGEVLATSYIVTNQSPVSVSMGKLLHDGPATIPSSVTSSEEPVETYDPEDPVVIVQITRIVEPLSTVPPPAEPSSTTVLRSGRPPFPIFTNPPKSTSISNVVVAGPEGQDPAQPLLSETSSTSSTTIYTDNADALETSTSSSDLTFSSGPSSGPSSGNAGTSTTKYGGVPYGWNNTFSTMTKVYATGPTFGYDHLSHEVSASNHGFTAPTNSWDSYTIPSEDAANPPALIPGPDHIFVGGEKAYSYSVSVSGAEGGATSTGYYLLQPTATGVDSVSKTDAFAASTSEYAENTSKAPLFSHGVTDLPTSAVPVPSSTAASNETMTSAFSEGESSTRPVNSVPPSDILAPSFLTPTVTQTGLPPLGSIASQLTAELPASIISLWSSLEEFGSSTTSVPQNTVPPSGILAPSFLIPTVIVSGLPPLESMATQLTEDLPASIISLWSSLDDLKPSTTSVPGNGVAPTDVPAPSFLIPTLASTITELFTEPVVPVNSVPPTDVPAPSFLIPTLAITPTELFTEVVPSTTTSASATATGCGEQGSFSLNFDDIPPLVGDVDQPLPIFSPYKHFYFSEGFAVGPPPRIPFRPDSAPLILQFQTQSDINVTRNDNFPAPGEWGATGEIGNGENLRWGCYSFDAEAAAVGCDSLGPDCEWQFTGITYDPATGNYDEPYTQFATTPGCPAGQDCALTDLVFLENFKNIQGLRVNVTVEGVPKIWWMDNLELTWSENSCEAGNCRASHR